MSVVIVDTSSWITYFRGDEHSELDDALRDSRIRLPPIVVAELLSGPLSSQEQSELADFLVDLPMCDTPFDHWRRVGRLRSALASRGLTVSTPDAHVAQCCFDLDAELISEDSIFRRIAKLKPLRLVD